jgi:acyl-CoA thioester hydrolase
MRFDLPAALTLVYSQRFPIRWGDMDAMGHVNNAMYFRYLETVRIDWFRALNFAPDPSGEGPVIVNAFCNFHSQLEYPGEVLAKQYVGAMGRSSIDTYTTLERADEPGKTYSSGGATVVWINFPQQKSVAIPDAIRERIASPAN